MSEGDVLGTVASVRTRASALAAQLVRLAEGRGRPDLVERLQQELAVREEPSTVVVVAGETGRGKSSLINALLDHPNLSPVDVDVATSSYVVVRHAPETSVRVVTDGDSAGEAIELGELEDWATAYGNPDNQKGVRAIEIGLDHPLLALGLTLVDTPGVGGLVGAHAAVAKAALRTADVLLFVVDASGPLTRPERDFLLEVTDRIEAVLIAMTKRDAYRGWGEILDDDRALLASTRLAGTPIIAVSSTLQLGAQGMEEPHRAVLLEESGFAELEHALADLAVGKAGVLRAGNLLSLSQTVIERLDEVDEAVIEATGATGKATKLEAARTREAEFKAKRPQAGRALERKFRRLGQELDLELNRGLADVRRRYETRIAEGQIETLLQELEAEMQAVLVSLSASLAERAYAVISQLRSELELTQLGDVDVGGVQLAEIAPLPTSGQPAVSGGLMDVFASFTPFYFARGLGSFLGFLIPGGALIGSAFGLILAGATWKKRKGIQDRQEARSLLMETVDWARREIPPAVRDEVWTLKDSIEEAVLTSIDAREKELALAVDEVNRAAREDAKNQLQLRAHAVSRRKDLGQHRATIASLRAELTQTVQPVATGVQKAAT